MTTVALGRQPGKPVGWLAICQDLSGGKELERLRADAVSYLAHDLRAPLTNIKLYADTLKSRVAAHDSQTQQEFTAGILEETNRLADLVNDLVASGRAQGEETGAIA